jgi:hypothetical protein
MFKRDILAGLLTYSTDKRLAANLETITAERAKEIIEMNRRGEKPESLQPSDQQREPEGPVDLLAGDSITRFDKAKKKKKKKKQPGNNNKPQEAQGGNRQPKDADGKKPHDDNKKKHDDSKKQHEPQQ